MTAVEPPIGSGVEGSMGVPTPEVQESAPGVGGSERGWRWRDSGTAAHRAERSPAGHLLGDRSGGGASAQGGVAAPGVGSGRRRRGRGGREGQGQGGRRAHHHGPELLLRSSVTAACSLLLPLRSSVAAACSPRAAAADL